MRPQGTLRPVLFASALLATPVLCGANGNGCGPTDVPIGSDTGGGGTGTDCTPSACGAEPALAPLCPDGTSPSSVCEQTSGGTCGWVFPPCPPPTTCTPSACGAEPDLAKECPDGTDRGARSASKGSGSTCGWVFPAVPHADAVHAGRVRRRAQPGDPVPRRYARGSYVREGLERDLRLGDPALPVADGVPADRVRGPAAGPGVPGRDQRGPRLRVDRDRVRLDRPPLPAAGAVQRDRLRARAPDRGGVRGRHDRGSGVPAGLGRDVRVGHPPLPRLALTLASLARKLRSGGAPLARTLAQCCASSASIGTMNVSG